MNLKTLDKEHAIHVLNLVSMVMAFGVTCYFFDTIVTNHMMKLIGDLLITPVFMADRILGIFGMAPVSGNFLIMFFILWFSYALPMRRLHPFLMVKNHRPEDLHAWYLDRNTRH